MTILGKNLSLAPIPVTKPQLIGYDSSAVLFCAQSWHFPTLHRNGRVVDERGPLRIAAAVYSTCSFANFSISCFLPTLSNLTVIFVFSPSPTIASMRPLPKASCITWAPTWSVCGTCE